MRRARVGNAGCFALADALAANSRLKELNLSFNDIGEHGAVALAPSTETGKSAGLLFYFSPYAVGGYVEGSYTAYVQLSGFKDDLSPEGAALFGGERPQDDGKED